MTAHEMKLRDLLYRVNSYTLEELQALRTISSTNFDNLKVSVTTETFPTPHHCRAVFTSYRVWLSRMTVADGAEYDNQVTVEQLINGNWERYSQYQAE
jgi:hypothetical protein